jgi:hypothetical protein
MHKIVTNFSYAPNKMTSQQTRVWCARGVWLFDGSPLDLEFDAHINDVGSG